VNRGRFKRPLFTIAGLPAKYAYTEALSVRTRR